MSKRIVAAMAGLFIVPMAEALACAVCWGGGSDSSMITGTKMSMIFMAVLTYLIVGGLVAGFVVIARRSSAAATPPPGEHRQAG